MNNCTLQDLTNKVSQLYITTKNIIVKPNWVSGNNGEYTEAEILDSLLKAFPDQNKIIIESYTPWRGLKFVEEDDQKGEGVTLEGGRKHWDFYKRQDEHFLKETGTDKVLQKHDAKYINITNEVWDNNCVETDIIKNLVALGNKSVKWDLLYSFIPKKIFELRKESTFVSLAKIKTEQNFPTIMISMSVKNLFGLIPHPSRWVPFHGENHESVPEVIKDVYTIYTTLFENSLWIAEGIKTMLDDYEGPNHKVIKNKQLLFLGTDGVAVDSEAAQTLGLDPKKIDQLQI